MDNAGLTEVKTKVKETRPKAAARSGKKAIPQAPLSVNLLEKELLQSIRKHGEITKPVLVDSLSYSRSKINGGINSLLKKNYIMTNGSGDYTGGRRSVKFSINGGLGLVAGFDIGATSIDLALTDLAGHMYARKSEPADIRLGPKTIVARIAQLLNKALAENNLDKSLLHGIGIGVPGPVDFKNGFVISPPIMPGWDGYPIVDEVQKDFPGVKVVVDNDVNVMAIGERSRDGGDRTRNLIFVKIGTGIGAGIICNGEIYRGNDGCAGDIGHISIRKDGPLCHCGNKGCLEAMAGGPAIADRAQKAVEQGKSSILEKYLTRNGGKVTAEDVGNAAREGDILSIEVIRESGQMIGEALAGLVNFFNPKTIYIGGGVSNIGNLLLSSIRTVILSRSTALATRNLRIDFAPSGADAGVTGAISLATESVFLLEKGLE